MMTKSCKTEILQLFSYRQTSTAKLPLKYTGPTIVPVFCLQADTDEPSMLGFVCVASGGAEGNRTPVRKQLGKTFSGRSLLFTFPLPHGNKHSYGIGSFMMRGMGKAYHTHGLHSNDTRARLVDLPGRMRA